MNSTGTGWGIMDGGVGQGTTTREFGEETGALYSGGGGGGMNNFSKTAFKGRKSIRKKAIFLMDFRL